MQCARSRLGDDEKREGLLDDDETEDHVSVPEQDNHIGEVIAAGSEVKETVHEMAVYSDTQKAKSVLKIVTWVQLVIRTNSLAPPKCP